MLTGLHLRNFVICENSHISFNNGFTAISGETGAGKSIMFDALALVTGSRASYGMIMSDKDSAVITASFDVSKLNAVMTWLSDKEIECSGEIVIKRAIKSNKTSKCFINGEPVSVGMLSDLGYHLVRIYEQHSHHELMSPKNHTSFIDDLMSSDDLLLNTKNCYKKLTTLIEKKKFLQDELSKIKDRRELLDYHIVELNNLDPSHGEFSEISAQHKILSNAADILQKSDVATNLISESDVSIESLASELRVVMSSLADINPHYKESLDLIDEATINIQEVGSIVSHLSSDMEVNPAEELSLSERMGKYLSLSKKHNVEPDLLLGKLIDLKGESDKCGNVEADLSEIDLQIQSAESNYWEVADKLKEKRLERSRTLEIEMKDVLPNLGLKHARFSCRGIELDKPTENGSQKIEFLFSANPGQDLDSLNKVVSGGELSRIALALQVIAANTISMPTLIFDEVDVGIGGRVAETVGGMLRRIGSKAQTIAVTHQASVAASAHSNLLVEKKVSGNIMTNSVLTIEAEEKVKEIARMLSGDQSEEAITHAKLVINRVAI